MREESSPVRHRVTVRALTQEQADGEHYYVAGTAAERIAMVWPLTLELCSFTKGLDAQSRLPRSVIRVRKLRR